MNVDSLILLALIMVLLPLGGTLAGGLFGQTLGRTFTHRLLITLVAISFFLSCYLFKIFAMDKHPGVEGVLYTWATAGMLHFDVAFLLDPLSITMTTIVLFVSLMVHIYTIGYMADDPGYQRFFCYVSLFTFSMLILVLANNFLLLFFGWEGVGLVSYLLIGFWFKRETALLGSLKAFIVNRVGDFGFVLAIAAILMYFGTLNYHQVFQQVPDVINQRLSIISGWNPPVITIISFLLFFGAMA